MMDNLKKFAELLSADESLKKDFEAAVSGISKSDIEAYTDAAVKVAAKHGITLTDKDFDIEMKELSMDEMSAVAGGSVDAWCNLHGWFHGECGVGYQW